MGWVSIHHDDVAPDDAVEIGVAAQGRPVTLRRVELTAGGQVQYGGEEPATLFGAVLRYLPDDPAPLTRFEVKADPRASPIRTADHLVLTEDPYHNGWQVSARFKPAWHGDKDTRAAQIAEAVQRQGASPSSRRERVQRMVDGLAFDPFETGRFLTAAPGDPAAVMAPKPRNPGWDTRWVLGVCNDVDGCQTALRESDRARQLVDLAGSGQLDVGPPGHRRRVKGAVTAEASQLMYLAARQALAGPADGQDDGVPVLKLVEWLFKNHIYNWLRKEQGEPPTTPWRD